MTATSGYFEKKNAHRDEHVDLFETPTLFFPFFYLDTCLVLTEYHNQNIIKPKVSQVLC
jgi:hypothetical protein